MIYVCFVSGPSTSLSPPSPLPLSHPRQSEVVKCVIDDVARAHKKGNTALYPPPCPLPLCLVVWLMCSRGSMGRGGERGARATYSVGNFADILDKTATKCPTRMSRGDTGGGAAVGGSGVGWGEAKISTVKVQDERVTTCKTSDKRNGSQVEAKRKRKLHATQCKKKVGQLARKRKRGSEIWSQGAAEVAESKANIMLTIWQAAC